jgi:type II secretory pathway component PulJ
MRPTSFRSARSSARSRGGIEDRGATLIELIVTISLLGLVVGTLLASFLSMQKSEAYVSDRTSSLDDMRVTMSRLTRELRQGIAIVGTPTTSDLTIETFIDGEQHQVRYLASGTTLTRSVDGGTAAMMQQHLASTAVFSYTDDAPDLVTVTLDVVPQQSPDTTVTLESEVRLRNMTEADS